MSKLKELGITIAGSTTAGDLFQDICSDFRTIEYTMPHEYVRQLWERYVTAEIKNNNLNGKFFEIVLATLFAREGLLPLYISARVAFVPNVNYDIMLYTENNVPICISAKTSLRERYKQADLEAIALKYVHRKAESYLVTLNEVEAESVKRKIQTGDVIGLNEVVLADKTEFNNLITRLKSYTFVQPSKIEIITSNQVVTKEKWEKVLDA